MFRLSWDLEQEKMKCSQGEITIQLKKIKNKDKKYF